MRVIRSIFVQIYVECLHISHLVRIQVNFSQVTTPLHYFYNLDYPRYFSRPVYTGDFCRVTQCNFCRAEVATSCDFSAILVLFVSAKRQWTSISWTKAVRLLESELPLKSHRVPRVAAETAAINCTKSHWNHSWFTRAILKLQLQRDKNRLCKRALSHASCRFVRAQKENMKNKKCDRLSVSIVQGHSKDLFFFRLIIEKQNNDNNYDCLGGLTLSVHYVFKILFLITMSINYLVDTWWEYGKWSTLSYFLNEVQILTTNSGEMCVISFGELLF